MTGTMLVVGQGAVRVRLDVNDAQAGLLRRAAGARRFAHNWAVAKIKANADQWQAEASYDIAKPDRVRPLSYFDLAKLWTAAKPAVNAAANLAAWGEAQLAGRTQVGDRHPGGPSEDVSLHACGGSNEPAAATLAGAPVETGTSRPRTRVT